VRRNFLLEKQVIWVDLELIRFEIILKIILESKQMQSIKIFIKGVYL
jgi:hypothetical protein